MKLHDTHELYSICGGIVNYQESQLTHFVFKSKVTAGDLQAKGMGNKKEFFSCNGVPCVATFYLKKGEPYVTVDPVSKNDKLPLGFNLDLLEDGNNYKISMVYIA